MMANAGTRKVTGGFGGVGGGLCYSTDYGCSILDNEALVGLVSLPSMGGGEAALTGIKDLPAARGLPIRPPVLDCAFFVS